MKVEQIYTGCLAQGAYYIESEGEVAIVDPLREIQPYLKKAEKDGATIKYILETHFHADFVSGHVDLAKATGATIVYGPGAQPNFDAHVAQDDEVLKLGKVEIKVLHTPGHTMESSCYLLLNEKGKQEAVFTGDTLFIGDVGRPDLAQKAAHMTQEELAATLYHSLRNKVMTLSDDVVVYPGHGAGSACGKNMSKDTVSTIGAQKRTNYALRADMTEEEFVKEVTDGLLPPPAYFPMNVRMNKEGYESIDDVLSKGVRPLSPEAFEAAANETGALVLDTRQPDQFGKAFIPNSINIGLGGQFAPWAGALIPEGQAILLVTEEGKEEEAVTRLARVGYDNTLGYLKGGLEAWKKAGKETDSVSSIDAKAFAQRYEKEKTLVMDVRKPGEFASEHVENAVNLPLDYINEHLAEFPKDKPFYLHCAGGYRSMIAASILKARGWDQFVNVEGGFEDIKKTAVPRTDYVCPSTLK
ncbi:MBL fold metallo-hydrolase [Catalinimonas niigatensis]|uniref:MBL fold metallo-hydrolase n=1 Tax=Catalinimonas niigatensis TaxID=1397264 RepID=UPI00266605FD|nr:MBL fold metallo-hydrolase [Catalinimonas niigatensis]WPP49713.1 MBL fold metallo-hydrolase [Catalinimonas niigatensis]